MRSVVGPGIGSAMSKRSALLRLAEVRRVEQLLEADDLRAARRGIADAFDRVRDVLRHVAGGAVLNDPDREGRGHARKLTTPERADSRRPRIVERQRTITPITTSFTFVPVSRRGMSALAARSALYDSCAASACAGSLPPSVTAVHVV